METCYLRVWEEEDVSTIEEMFIPDPDIKQLRMLTPIDLEQFKVFHKLIYDELKNIDIRTNITIEQGDWLAARCSYFAKMRLPGRM